MDKIADDSNIIKSLLENDNIDFEELPKYFPNVDFNLLQKYYGGMNFSYEDLLKLAEDMNFLDCHRLESILYVIGFIGLDYSSLNEDLKREIIKNPYLRNDICVWDYVLNLIQNLIQFIINLMRNTTN